MSRRVLFLLLGLLATTARGAAGQSTLPPLHLPQTARVTGNMPADDLTVGEGVAIDGDTMLVGAELSTVGSNNFQGAVYVFVRNGATWSVQARLVASDGTSMSRFGFSLALSGDTAVIGAPGAAGPNAANQGAAYVFTRSGTTWAQDARLTAADGTAVAQFGVSVALSGTTAIVGANGDTNGRGAVYVFTKIADIWTRGPKLMASDGTDHALFGSALAFDGDTLLVGAPSADVAGVPAGAVYPFTRSSDWSPQTRLIASDPHLAGNFGRSVALHQDTALIGSPCGTGISCPGSAYVFTHSGTTWSQMAQLQVQDHVASEFGTSVALNNDFAVVGTPGNITFVGAACVYTGSASTWTLQATLHADGTPNFSDLFGFSVAVTGETVAVGAPQADPHGAAFVFENTAPTISHIGPQTTPENTPISIPFTVSDSESPVEELFTFLTSSNRDLVTQADTVVTGTGTTRTLTITPKANQSGQTNIGFFIADGYLASPAFFQLTVTPLNTAPTIAAIADRTVVQDRPLVVPVTVGDVDTPLDQLIVSATSSNHTLLPDSAIVAGGSGADRTLTITANPTQIGDATITVTVSDGSLQATTTFMLTTSPRTYYLAEGSTGGFFDTDLLLANPNDAEATVAITFFKENGGTVAQARTLPPLSRTTIRVADVDGMQNGALSTAITSTNGLPIVVERTMHWDATGYGSHGEKASDGLASQWYFAEGSQGFFSTFFLLVNPGNAASAAHVTYFREGEAPLQRDYALPPASRVTIDAAADPELVNRSFGALVLFDQPGAAERAMYFGRDPLWSGGHDSAGVDAPSTSWFLAEGATGSFFNTFVLLANPNADDATATLTYFPASGTPVTRQRVIPGGRRVTINLAEEDPSLASAAISTKVDATLPIIVERSQYWPVPSWYEGHNAFGVTATGTHWGLAEGRVGGAAAYQTYILLANPGTQPAEVTVRFLRVSGPPLVKTFTVAAATRFNIGVTGDPHGDVPELTDEAFGADIQSTQPIVVERAMYNDAGGVVWAAGTGATATRLP